jgi:hypothetical protein
MTLLDVRKTQVHVWKIPRAGSMNGMSVGGGRLRRCVRRRELVRHPHEVRQ